MDFINYLVIVFSCLLAIPTLFFTVQVAVAAVKTIPSTAKEGRRPSIAILIPAHNEERIISQTLNSISPQLQNNDRLLVVADNCSDDTANIARKFSKHVIERRDETQCGKGYALDFGLQFLADNEPPEVVIIIDADCQISETCIDVLAKQAESENRPVQALYLMQSPEKKSIAQAIAEFAWKVKNQVRPLGMMRLGLPCQLMGSGMAFPWELLQRVNLANGNMVEDMKLGVDLALLGFSPSFCPNALVTSEFPSSTRVTNEQRKRWEHGHLTTIFTELPRLFATAFKQKNYKLLSMALDLSVPPLSLLGLCLVITFSLSVVLMIVTNNATSIEITSVLMSIFMTTVLIAWFKFGREIMTFKDLCGIPFYILRKIPLYFSFLLNRQQEWVKTERD